jgi:hypothetical protein
MSVGQVDARFYFVQTSAGDTVNTGSPAPVRVITAPDRPIARNESVDEILSAGMDGVGVGRALRTLELLRAWGPFEEFALATDDHGMTLEFSQLHSPKQVLVVIPKDGSTAYFSARANNFRKAGVILNDLGIQSLGSWAVSAETDLHGGGLEIAPSTSRSGPQARR